MAAEPGAVQGPWPAEKANAWAGATLAGRLQLHARARRSTSSRCGRPTRSTSPTIDRELGWAEVAGVQQRPGLPPPPPLGAGPRRLPRSGWTVPGRRRPAQDRRDVRPVRQRLGPVPPSPASSARRGRACTTPAGCKAPAPVILKNPDRHDELKAYIKGVIGRFRDDRRVHAWDLINEPDNTNGSSYGKHRAEGQGRAGPHAAQEGVRLGPRGRPRRSRSPRASGSATGASPTKLSPMERFQLEKSDVISFHNYEPLDDMKQCVENLRRYGRPILCTEYMARPQRQHVRPDPRLSQGAEGRRRTTGASSRARPRRSTRGTRGRSRTPPSRPSGSTTSSAPTARPTTAMRSPTSAT